MSIFTKTKERESTDLEALVEQLLAQVPDLATGPAGEPLRQLARRREELTTAKRRILHELETVTGDGPGGPMSAIRYNAEADAESLLAGADIETLVAPAEETRRGSLLRQLRATAVALELLQDRIRETDAGLVASEFERLKPALREIMAAVAGHYERLRVALESLNRLDVEFSHRGFPIGRRPSLMGGFDLDTLHGCTGRPSLAWWIENFSKTWGLDETDK